MSNLAPSASASVDAFGTPFTIEDAEGTLLFGEPSTGPAGTRVPVRFEGADVGWVTGASRAAALAALLDHLVAREAEKKALGAEVLHLYREINLIYSFSEKLAALLDLNRVAALTLIQGGGIRETLV